MKRFELNGGEEVYLFRNRAANVYIIVSGNTRIIVDTGSRSTTGVMIDNINSIKGAGRITHLLLTHTHYDHCFNASLLKDLYDPLVVVGEAEKEYLIKGFAPLPDGTHRWSKVVVSIGRSLNPDFFSYPGLKPDITIEGSYTIDDTNIEILPTPGHTMGSLSLIVNKEIAVVGDALFGSFMKKIFPPFADSVPTLLKSWKLLLDTGCNLFLPAHGSPVKREILERQYDHYSLKFSQ